ncbi:MAG TPA: hypothetical protein VIY86_15230, partial [Pirellulaceae bacterium]
MVFEDIEELKRVYTDKYVVVDDTLPELRRFRGQTGLVKTVNMSGRALVMFDAFANIGWYDIDVGSLKFVDKPLPKETVKEEKKPVAKPVANPAAAAGKPAVGGTSTADILAAARGGKAGAPAAKPPAANPKAAKPAAGQPNVSDILAAARA